MYFMSTDGRNIVTLDCEDGITVSQSNTTTRNSVMTGKSISDSFIRGNKTVDVTGVVTYSKTPSQINDGNPNPAQFTAHVENMINSRQRFTLFADQSYSKLLRDVEDCVIASWNYVVDEYEDTITVSMTFEEQFVSQAAQVTYLAPKPSKEAAKSIQDKEGGGQTSKENVEPEERKTLLKHGFDEGLGFLRGIQG